MIDWKNIFRLVAERVKDRSDSLLHTSKKFPRSGIEGWLKVEAARALGESVKKLKNRGPDIELVKHQFIELKGATDCNPSWIIQGIEKYQSEYQSLACLFIGSGRGIDNCIRELGKKSKILNYEKFDVGSDKWIIGLICPKV